jgi:hypothetical protein
MPMYCTLDQAKAEARMKDGFESADDNALVFLQAAIRFVSARIERETRYEFAPRYMTDWYDARGAHVVDYRLLELTQMPFLSLTTVKDGLGNTLVAGTDYYPYPRGKTPITALRLIAGSGRSWTQYSTDWRDAIEVTGIAGYHADYAEAWFSSGDSVQDDPQISSTETLITVEDVDEEDAYGQTPRFSPGNLIRLESEFCEVIATNPSTDTLTVRRGVNGSTAATHVKNTVIDVFQVEPNIQRAALRWVGYLLQRRGAYEQTSFDGVATVTFPKDAPGEVEAILAQYRKVRWSVI